MYMHMQQPSFSVTAVNPWCRTVVQVAQVRPAPTIPTVSTVQYISTSPTHPFAAQQRLPQPQLSFVPRMAAVPKLMVPSWQLRSQVPLAPPVGDLPSKVVAVAAAKTQPVEHESSTAASSYEAAYTIFPGFVAPIDGPCRDDSAAHDDDDNESLSSMFSESLAARIFGDLDDDDQVP